MLAENTGSISKVSSYLWLISPSMPIINGLLMALAIVAFVA
jgi:hypothetical protein